MTPGRTRENQVPTPLDVAKRAEAPLPKPEGLHSVQTPGKPKRKRRRKRKNQVPEAQRCQREGCSRPKAEGGHQYCSFGCWCVDSHVMQAERVCRAAGPGTASTEMWLAAVALNDALTTYQRLDSRLAYEVRDRFTDEEWRAIKSGTNEKPPAYSRGSRCAVSR
jgi:hypothetical protein